MNVDTRTLIMLNVFLVLFLIPETLRMLIGALMIAIFAIAYICLNTIRFNESNSSKNRIDD